MTIEITGDGIVKKNGNTALSINNTPQVSFENSVSQPGGFSLRNKIINGNFDIWQRGTTQTGSGYGSADRWLLIHSGSTKTASRQSFTLGQTEVPGEPTYFMRHVVTSSAGASNYVLSIQKIESVRTLAGKTVTLSFWAKADSNKNIAIDFQQHFGTGGSPSTAITGIGVNKIQLTSSWTKYSLTVSIPSISNKTLGSDNNDYLELAFWFDAGSDFNNRTDSLGQQSGTFDIAQVQLEEGSVSTPFEQRPIGMELSLCQRYFYKTFAYETAPAQNVASNNYLFSGNFSGILQGFKFPVVMRGNPSITTYNPYATNSNFRIYSGSDLTIASVTAEATGVQSIATSSYSAPVAVHGHFTANAEL